MKPIATCTRVTRGQCRSTLIAAGAGLASVVPRPGWTVTVAGPQVSWYAASPEAALPDEDRAEFMLRGRLTKAPGVLCFPMLQTRYQVSAEWRKVPPKPQRSPEFTAGPVDALPAGGAALHVRGRGAGPATAGQDTGVFMNAGAPSGCGWSSNPSSCQVGQSGWRRSGRRGHTRRIPQSLVNCSTFPPKSSGEFSGLASASQVIRRHRSRAIGRVRSV